MDTDLAALRATIERTGLSLAVIREGRHTQLALSIRDPRHSPEPRWFLICGSGDTHEEAAKDLAHRLEELHG